MLHRSKRKHNVDFYTAAPIRMKKQKKKNHKKKLLPLQIITTNPSQPPRLEPLQCASLNDQRYSTCCNGFHRASASSLQMPSRKGRDLKSFLHVRIQASLQESCSPSLVGAPGACVDERKKTKRKREEVRGGPDPYPQRSCRNFGAASRPLSIFFFIPFLFLFLFLLFLLFFMFLDGSESRILPHLLI